MARSSRFRSSSSSLIPHLFSGGLAASLTGHNSLNSNRAAGTKSDTLGGWGNMRKWLILFGLLAVSTHAKKADWKCSMEGFVETCEFWLDPKDVSVVATTAPTPQQQANWCWLASIEMAFRFHGYRVPQAKLLDQLWGKIEDMPGRPEQILGATNRVYTDDAGKRFRAESMTLQNWWEVSVSLGNDVPVLVGAAQPGGVGHMTMIAGIQIKALYNQANQIIDTQVWDVVLWDPWPGQGLRNMTQGEFDNVSMLVAVGATALDPVVAVRKPGKAPARGNLRYFNVLGRSIR